MRNNWNEHKNNGKLKIKRRMNERMKERKKKWEFQTYIWHPISPQPKPIWLRTIHGWPRTLSFGHGVHAMRVSGRQMWPTTCDYCHFHAYSFADAAATIPDRLHVDGFIVINVIVVVSVGWSLRWRRRHRKKKMICIFIQKSRSARRTDTRIHTRI